MTKISLQDARSHLVRDRVLNGVADVLVQGDDLTFARIAKAAGVPERTIYRYFPDREALFAAIFDWANHRIGFQGEPPTDEAGAAALVRRVFPGFDEIAPVIHELLSQPEGRAARLSEIGRRRNSALALVHKEAPNLDKTRARRIAAVVQMLTAASTWQTLHDYWDMDGTEAAETSALAIELIFRGARATRKSRP